MFIPSYFIEWILLPFLHVNIKYPLPNWKVGHHDELYLEACAFTFLLDLWCIFSDFSPKLFYYVKKGDFVVVIFIIVISKHDFQYKKQ